MLGCGYRLAKAANGGLRHDVRHDQRPAIAPGRPRRQALLVNLRDLPSVHHPDGRDERFDLVAMSTVVNWLRRT